MLSGCGKGVGVGVEVGGNVGVAVCPGGGGGGVDVLVGVLVGNGVAVACPGKLSQAPSSKATITMAKLVREKCFMLFSLYL